MPRANVMDTIAHLKRAGLVSASSTGFGFNGGAAPDWLVSEQKAKREALAKKRAREWVRQHLHTDEAA